MFCIDKSLKIVYFLLQLFVFGLLVTIVVISNSANGKLFKKKKWLPKLFGKHLGFGGVGGVKGIKGVGGIGGIGGIGGFGDGGSNIALAYEEHPRIVEIVRHVPVIQKVEVIKPVEIIKIVHVPGEITNNFPLNFLVSAI